MCDSVILWQSDIFETTAEKSVFTDRYLFTSGFISSIIFDVQGGKQSNAIGFFNTDHEGTYGAWNWELRVGPTITPTNLIASGTCFPNQAVLAEFDQIDPADRYFELTFDNPIRLVNCIIGEALNLEEGMPIGWSRPSQIDGNIYEEKSSEAGFPLGKMVMEMPRKMSISQSDMSREFYQDQWLPLVKFAAGDITLGNSGLFYFSHDIEVFPDEAVICVSDRTPSRQFYNTGRNEASKIKVLAYGEVYNTTPPQDPAWLWDDTTNIEWDDETNIDLE